MKRILLLFLSSIYFTVHYASHVPGGNITYECVGPNTFVITLTMYEDCATSFTSSNPMSIFADNDCGLNFPGTVDLPNIIYQQEISQLCSGSQTSSQCSGGTLPGLYMHVWQDTIVLPDTCDSWVFSYSSCCRNTSLNLSGIGNNYYWETILNSTTSVCNSSPVITAPPLPFTCVNQPVVYNFGVYEPDGNVLVYSLIDALQSATNPVVYQAGYSGVNAIPGIVIDAATGEITFTPTTIGNYVVAVLIEEFDANGDLVGSVIQDFQILVINCQGNNSPIPASSITNITGTGLQIGPYELDLCIGESMCFDVEFTDDVTDSVFLSSNAQLLFPGATFTQNTYTSPVTATLCFEALPGTNPFSTIYIEAQDQACPIYGMGTMNIGVTVNSRTYAGDDAVICAGSELQLNASGGSNFTWSVISGDPINIGINFSCNNCSDPIASPSVTTVYEVTSNLSGSCINIDTIEISVAPDFTYTASSSNSNPCILEEVALSTIVSINPSGYTYQWSPIINLSNPNISNPLISLPFSGSYSYIVEITSGDGCSHQDTIKIMVNTGVQPIADALASDTIPLCGSLVYLSVELDSILTISEIEDDFDPSINSAIWSSLNEAGAGSGCGVNSGTNALDFLGPSGERWATTIPFNTSMCTSIEFCMYMANDLSTGSSCENCDPGDDVEFQYSIDGGMTWILVKTLYESWWDTGGIYEDSWSCLTIPISAVAVTNNTQFRWYQTPTQGGGLTGYDNWSLDDVKINCNASANYSYQWTPATGLSSTIDDLTELTVPLNAGSISYQVVVVDIIGNCSDTSIVQLAVQCDTCISPDVTSLDPSCFSVSDGSILVQPIGSPGPWNITLTDVNSGLVIQNNNNIFTNTIFQNLPEGTYMISTVDTTGCSNDVITDIEYVSIATASADTSICIGDGIQLNSGGGLTYLWSMISGDSINLGVNFSCLNCSDPVASPSSSTIYQVMITDSNMCDVPYNIEVIVQGLPVINAGIDQDLCLGDSVQLNATGGATYSWSPIGTLTDPLIANPYAFPSDTTIYFLFGTDSLGCSNIDSILINVISCDTISHSINFDNGQEIFIYPNPTTDKIMVDLDRIDLPCTVSIKDNRGRLVYRESVDIYRTEIDLSNYQKGVYMLLIENNNLIRTIKIIKQ